MKTEIKNHVKDLEGFVNEQKLNETMFPNNQNILKQNGVELGDMIYSISEFMTGAKYCLLDLGDGEWRPGYEYVGKKGGNHIFKNTLEPGAPTVKYSEKEFDDMIQDDLWAEEAWND